MNQIILHNKTFIKYINHQDILLAVKNIALQINEDMKNETEPPIFLSVLNGAFMFTSDLMKYIDFNCTLSFIKINSYKGTSSKGNFDEPIGLNTNLEGKTVIVVEDIVDKGATIEFLVDKIKKQNPKVLKIASMFFKPEAYKKDIKIDYTGINIAEDFVVGYGLDYDELGRNYSDIYKIVTKNV